MPSEVKIKMNRRKMIAGKAKKKRKDWENTRMNRMNLWRHKSKNASLPRVR